MSETRKGLDAIEGLTDDVRAAHAARSQAASVRRSPRSRPAGVRYLIGNQPSGEPASVNHDPGFTVEPVTGLRRPPVDHSCVGDEREPIVDLFTEPDCVLVVAEMPGVDPATVRVELHGDVLVLHARGPGRRYRTEQLLPQAFGATALSHRYAVGILEVRLQH